MRRPLRTGDIGAENEPGNGKLQACAKTTGDRPSLAFNAATASVHDLSSIVVLAHCDLKAGYFKDRRPAGVEPAIMAFFPESPVFSHLEPLFRKTRTSSKQ